MKHRITQLKLIWHYYKIFQTDIYAPLPVIFEFVNKLDKDKMKKIYRRFQKTKTGKKLLNKKEHFLDLVDKGNFKPGTFGYEFQAWRKKDKLVDVFSMYYPPKNITPLSQFLRYSVMYHDMIHFLNEYDTSPYGEIGVLSFHLAQEWRDSYASILYSVTIMSFVNTFIPAKYPPRPLWKNIIFNPLVVFILTVIEGYRRGKRAPWLMEVDFESYLNVDLQQVKKDLYLEKPPSFWKKMAPTWAIVKEKYLNYAKRNSEAPIAVNRSKI